MGLATAFKPPVVGLDVGSHAVKAVALRQGRRGWKLLAAGEWPMPYGEVATPSQAGEAAGALLDTLGLKRARISAALSGQAVIVKRLSLPPMSAAELAEAIPWEAEQYIPFALADVQLDYQVLERPRAMPAGSRGVPDALPDALDVLLVAARRDRVAERVDTITQTGRLPIVLDVEAFALANAYELNYPDRQDALVVLLHVGRNTTVVCVLEDGRAAFTRDISLGGGAYVEALERDLGLDPAGAQRALRSAPGAEGVGGVLREVHQQLVLEVRKTLDFYGSTAKATGTSGQTGPSGLGLDRLVLSGGACQIEGLASTLTDEFQVAVEACDPFRLIERSARIDVEGPAYAVAVGLALRGEQGR